MFRVLLFLFIITGISAFSQPFAVVELFTSEGCSSCPPAEKVLDDIKSYAEKSGQKIYTIEYHVDYWNRLGWKDPFSKFQFTTRQENYSRALADKQLFTPQMIINGTKSFVGSKREIINKSIEDELLNPASYDLKIKRDSVSNDTLYFSYTFPLQSNDLVLRVALTEDNLTSDVSRGENAGKKFIHRSVVRTLTSIDNIKKSGNGFIAISSIAKKEHATLIVFVQQKKTMKIMAANSITDL